MRGVFNHPMTGNEAAAEIRGKERFLIRFCSIYRSKENQQPILSIKDNQDLNIDTYHHETKSFWQLLSQTLCSKLYFLTSETNQRISMVPRLASHPLPFCSSIEIRSFLSQLIEQSSEQRLREMLCLDELHFLVMILNLLVRDSLFVDQRWIVGVSSCCLFVHLLICLWGCCSWNHLNVDQNEILSQKQTKSDSDSFLDKTKTFAVLIWRREEEIVVVIVTLTNHKP